MVKENYLSILKTFFIALIFLVIGGIIGVKFIPATFRYMLNIAFFVVVLFSAFSKRGGLIRNKASMYTYAFILGILTGSTYGYYFARLGPEIFISCIVGVLLVFAFAYFLALRTSEEKIMKLSPIIWGGILALIILEFINIFFFRFGIFDLLLSTAGILIYSLYAIYIMKSIQSRCRYGRLSEGEVVQLSYSIFISFLNLLLDLLRFMSIISDDN